MTPRVILLGSRSAPQTWQWMSVCAAHHEGPPAPRAVLLPRRPPFPDSDTAGGGADPSGTREGPGQPEPCTPNRNGFRGAPEVQAEPTGCHLGTWWDSSETEGLFSPGLYSGRVGPELLVSAHHHVEAEARAEIRSRKQREPSQDTESLDPSVPAALWGP